MLNDFCADTKTFSFRKLAFLRLRGLPLCVNAELQELTMVVSTEEDYQTVQWHLNPSKRLYQLLGLHFKKVHIVFGIPNDPIENAIHLETILLTDSPGSTDLRNANSVGARLRRGLNVVLQGHIAALWLYDDDDIVRFKKLWKRGRMIQLIEQHGIMHSYEAGGKLVKLWKSPHPEAGESVVITIK
jgi:hypothetical protein